jgi:predicted DNA-binding transcriptional regulator
MTENILPNQESIPSQDHDSNFRRGPDPFEQDQQLLERILKQFGLSDAEIAVYSYCRNQGEIDQAFLINKLSSAYENIQDIFVHLQEKGFLRENPTRAGYLEANAPFAVVFNRIFQYEHLLEDIKAITPQLFEEKFAEIQNFALKTSDIQAIQTILDTINLAATDKLTEQQKVFDQTMALFMDHERVEKALTDVKAQSANLIKSQFNVLKRQFVNLQVKILQNLEKLRLGVLTDVVKHIIQSTFKFELDNFESTFNRMFEANFRTITAGLEGELNQFENHLQEIGDSLKNTITHTQSNLTKSMDETKATLDRLTSQLTGLFQELQTQFSSNVLSVFEEILGKLTDQITMGSHMINQYWEGAQKNRQYTVEDVWFVDSVPKMRNQMEASIKRIKSKILIVAPRFEDIPIDQLIQLPSKVNIRIECNLNAKDPLLIDWLPQIQAHGNINLRHRNKTDLWAINRDFEELVIGIIASAKKQTKSPWDLVAIGSIIPAHITIFEQIIEQAWIEGRKVQFNPETKEVEIL